MKGKYYKTRESVKEYIELAKGVSGFQLIEKLRTYLTPNLVILEIGSGPGSDWKILNTICKAIGSDNSAEFLKHLIKENPDGEFLKLDAITLSTDKNFDGIYSNKVMHHLKNRELAESIQRQHGILNTDGIICHSFWKGQGSEIFKGLFVNYHTKASLKVIFQGHFEILLLEEYKEFEESDSILLIGKKKE